MKSFQSISRVLLLATVSTAVMSCSPVSNSISKVQPHSFRDEKQKDDDTIFSEMKILEETIVVPEKQYLQAEAKLPAGVKVDEIPKDQFDEFSVKGSTEVRLPGDMRLKSIQIYAILSLAIEPREAEKDKMDKVKLKWVKKGLNQFLITVSNEAGDEGSRKYVSRLLSRISIGYREIDSGVTR